MSYHGTLEFLFNVLKTQKCQMTKKYGWRNCHGTGMQRRTREVGYVNINITNRRIKLRKTIFFIAAVGKELSVSNVSTKPCIVV